MNFVSSPLLKVYDFLLATGIAQDDDIRQLLMLLDPVDFDTEYQPG